MKRFLLIVSMLTAFGLSASAQTISKVTPLTAGPTTLSTTSSGACAYTTDCVKLNVGGYTGVSVQITGTCGTCTVQFEATIDGTNWVALSMLPSNSTTPVTNAAVVGVWQASIGAAQIRARLSARSSGSFVISLRATTQIAKLSITDSGAAVPGGADTQVQFNDAGTLGGDSALVWDKAANVLTLAGSLVANTVTSAYVSSGTAPAVANTSANSCGTTAATIVGNDNNGVVTIGATAGTSCTLTFTVAAAVRRECVVTNETTANLARATYVDSTHSILAGTFVAGDKVSYVCFPR
jgi:hypothetical protein